VLGIEVKSIDETDPLAVYAAISSKVFAIVAP
jgi:hypothetical protein